MSVDIITATYNNPMLPRAILSVQAQTLMSRQIIVDGGSTLVPVDRIRPLLRPRDILISEPDEGVYDALNKGLSASTASIVGLLHSDDCYASPDTLERVADCFEMTNCDVLYGDLCYVSPRGSVLRYWRSGHFWPGRLGFGWMPPHPTMFVTKRTYDSLGPYNSGYRVAGDYEYVLRLFRNPDLRVMYLPTIITLMTTGGLSNGTLKGVLRKVQEDIRAMRAHRLSPLVTFPLKNLRKIRQYVVPRSVQRSTADHLASRFDSSSSWQLTKKASFSCE